MLEHLKQFKLLWSVAAFIGLVLGFQAITPMSRMSALEARVKRVETAQDTIIMELRMQRRLSCLDRDMRDRALVGLECGTIPYTGVPK